MTNPDPRALDRAKVPAPGPVRSFDFPSVTSSFLPNGLGLRIARMSRLPLVTLTLVVDAGESLLPASRAGLAVLSGSALDGGTQERTGPELAEALEGIGTSLVVSTGWDATTLSLTCVAERMGEAMKLMAETLLRPSFPPQEVARLRDQRLAAIRQRRMDPGSLADADLGLDGPGAFHHQDPPVPEARGHLEASPLGCGPLPGAEVFVRQSLRFGRLHIPTTTNPDPDGL